MKDHAGTVKNKHRSEILFWLVLIRQTAKKVFTSGMARNKCHRAIKHASSCLQFYGPFLIISIDYVSLHRRHRNKLKNILAIVVINLKSRQ